MRVQALVVVESRTREGVEASIKRVLERAGYADAFVAVPIRDERHLIVSMLAKLIEPMSETQQQIQLDAIINDVRVMAGK